MIVFIQKSTIISRSLTCFLYYTINAATQDNRNQQTSSLVWSRGNKIWLCKHQSIVCDPTALNGVKKKPSSANQINLLQISFWWSLFHCFCFCFWFARFVETKRYMDFVNPGSQAREGSFFCIEAALEGLEPGYFYDISKSVFPISPFFV